MSLGHSLNTDKTQDRQYDMECATTLYNLAGIRLYRLMTGQHDVEAFVMTPDQRQIALAELDKVKSDSDVPMYANTKEVILRILNDCGQPVVEKKPDHYSLGSFGRRMTP